MGKGRPKTQRGTEVQKREPINSEKTYWEGDG